MVCHSCESRNLLSKKSNPFNEVITKIDNRNPKKQSQKPVENTNFTQPFTDLTWKPLKT